MRPDLVLERESSSNRELVVVLNGREIVDVNCPSVDRDTAADGAAYDRYRRRMRNWSEVRARHQLISIAELNHRVRGLAQSSCARGDCFQHRLEIRRRAGDHTQDLGRRRLLLQGLLRFIEQPYTLNREHGLVSEGRD